MDQYNKASGGNTSALALTVALLCFGASDGKIQQAANLSYDTTTDILSTPRASVNETKTGASAGTERIGFITDQSVQFATGGIALQRANVFDIPSYSFVGASLITTAATVAIAGAPLASTNCTITNNYALFVQSGKSVFAGGATVTDSTTSEAFGRGASVSNDNSVAFGPAASAGFGHSVAVGRGANAGGGVGSVCIGEAAASTARSQFVVGSSTTDAYISDIFIGNGVTSIAPRNITYNATGGSGSNIVGGDIIIAAGRSTGNAIPASIVFKTGQVGGTGSTAQTLTERANIDGGGNFTIGVAGADDATGCIVLTTGGNVPSTPDGAIYMCAQDGASLNNLLSLKGTNAVSGASAAPATMVRWPIIINGTEYNLLLEV